MLPLLAVLAAWLVAVAAIGIGGDFPLGDDWSYAHAARSLCENGKFDLLPWTGASLFLQALYGAAACKVAGFSYVVLRTTTLAMSVCGIVATSALLVECGASPCVAAAGAAVVASCPLWLNLSFTFMTDVPFATLAVVSLWLTARSLRLHSRPGLVLAGVAAAAAFLIRQHAVSISAAAALAALLPPGRIAPNAGTKSDAGRRPGDRLVDAAAVVAVPVMTVIAYTAWAATSSATPLAVHNKLVEAARLAPVSALDVAFRALVTLGFLILPWTATSAFATGREKRVFALTLAVLGGIAGFVWVRNGSAMFYLGNIMGLLHVGARTTRDAMFLAKPDAAEIPGLARPILTVLCVISASRLVARLSLLVRLGGPIASTPAIRNDTRYRVAWLCVMALLLSGAGTLLQAHYYFDRYLVVLVPLAIASLVCLDPSPRSGAFTVAATIAMALYSVAGTHDYLAWNRARWGLLSELESKGIDATHIDGGFEYNAERLAARLRTSPTDAQAAAGQDALHKSWWWVVDDEWIVAFGPLAGYDEAASREYPRWLLPGKARVLLLHRTGTDGPAGSDAKAGGA
ncbi:MAG TPA: glycosyltransferase family 39 protein [Candidatus Binatia bacterium]